jgi:hypothetical protein
MKQTFELTYYQGEQIAKIIYPCLNFTMIKKFAIYFQDSGYSTLTPKYVRPDEAEKIVDCLHGEEVEKLIKEIA